ncbi:DNA-directed RNA polymerase subunit delta [Bacillus sp. IITD106]|nr:DNA-directed RNA polymerase subunit delta [Bacillus sp. IITD106]
MNILQLSKEERKEMSFIEIAQHIFEEKKEAISFKDLVDEIANYLELSEQEKTTRMLQFYTDLNVDGRFLSLGENRWGLREWYPIDQIDEEIITPVKPKKKKKAKLALEDDDLELEDEDLDFDLDEDEDFDDTDDLDEEEDESLEALREEEEEEFEDDELIEDDYEIEEDEEDLDLDDEDEELDLEEEEEEEE